MDSSQSGPTRRAFLGAVATAALESRSAGAVEIDLRELISRADLIYEKPVARSEEGIPIGNGRMGTLVWTTPTTLRMQINRADVYASDGSGNSFFERNSDYCGGCGYVDIDFGAESETFPESGFRQRLSVYDGVLAIACKDVSLRISAWPAEDVIAIEVDDRRAAGRVEVSLRMLRYLSQYYGGKLEEFAREHVVTVETRSHTAASRLLVRGERIVLTQEFREGPFQDRSALAIGMAGRRGVARIANETEARVAAAGGAGTFTILISTAASFDAREDVAGRALATLESAVAKAPGGIERETAEWWHAFWARGYISMHSADGAADVVEQNYHYFLYVMAASSRGDYPPKFNGMLWNTAGDLRTWGAQHWFANLSCYYEALFAANRLDLLDPVFRMYSGMYAASERAARQQWGSQGIFVPETVWFDGLEQLPEDIAGEMRELYLLRKPWEERSARWREFARTKHPHSSRWNWMQSGSWQDGRWVIVERGSGPFGNVSHILGTTAKIAYLYWRRYEYTQDAEWLRERAYPMLKGAVEFYRNFPNLKKGTDGKYHIHRVNSNEGVWGASDTDEDLSAMRGATAALLRAAEILGVDAEMLPVWREFSQNLAPLPTSDDADALKPADYKGPRVFVRGRKPAVQGRGFLPDGNSLPMYFFDLCNLDSRDRERLATAGATFDASFRNGLTARTPVGVLSKTAIAAATLGRADAVRYLVPNQIRALVPERATAYRGGGVLANRMTLREGPQALDAERLGRAAEALQLALLQSNPPEPGEDSAIRLAPAWPPEWSAQFRLLARGGFVVTATVENGRVRLLELESQAGSECRLHNPWGEAAVEIRRDGRKAETIAGALLRFGTRRGERIEMRTR